MTHFSFVCFVLCFLSLKCEKLFASKQTKNGGINMLIVEISVKLLKNVLLKFV